MQTQRKKERASVREIEHPLRTTVGPRHLPNTKIECCEREWRREVGKEQTEREVRPKVTVMKRPSAPATACMPPHGSTVVRRREPSTSCSPVVWHTVPTDRFAQHVECVKMPPSHERMSQVGPTWDTLIPARRPFDVSHARCGRIRCDGLSGTCDDGSC
jgi:hypothetical protein